jgi:glycosyltransferase involved in cell wall biosynthesis
MMLANNVPNDGQQAVADEVSMLPTDVSEVPFFETEEYTAPTGGDVPVDIVGRPLAKPRVSVVIPTRNEAKNLPYVFSRLPQDIYEVILVDGHSVDETVIVARSLYPAVRVLQETRRGKGSALVCGFAAARGDIVVTLDADGSADAGEIPAYVEALMQGADFAKGTRFLPGGGSSDLTRFRGLGNLALTGLVNLLFGTRYTDLCYGFNAFWADCLPQLNVDCDGFEVETLLNIRVAKAGLRVQEVASYEERRIYGASNLSAFRDGKRVLKTILREWWTRRAQSSMKVRADAAAERAERRGTAW